MVRPDRLDWQPPPRQDLDPAWMDGRGLEVVAPRVALEAGEEHPASVLPRNSISCCRPVERLLAAGAAVPPPPLPTPPWPAALRLPRSSPWRLCCCMPPPPPRGRAPPSPCRAPCRRIAPRSWSWRQAVARARTAAYPSCSCCSPAARACSAPTPPSTSPTWLTRCVL